MKNPGTDNPFAGGPGVGAYDRSRPFFHARIAQRLAELVPSAQRRRALDVACGTGQSTVALAAIFDTVVGIDASTAMLQQRRGRNSIRYLRGLAEQLPFRAEAFDLVSVGLALHWLDRVAFLDEARAVLRPASWLVVYDLNFAARMKESPLLGEWTSTYRRRFPHPSRNKSPLTADEIAAARLREVLSESFVHTEIFDIDALMSYLMTQSNVLQAIREGRDTDAGVRAWLRETLAPLFTSPTGTFEYDGCLRVFQRTT
jgi:ubiquinone/menaquinone biosynthesis C-methylase UbiE